MKWRHIFLQAIVPILFLQVLSVEAAVKTEEDIFLRVKLRELTERIRKEPKDAINWYEKGTYSYIAGDLPQAVEDFSRVIRIYPKNAHMHRIRGSLYLEEGKFDAALADFDQATRLSPKSGDMYFYRGLAHYAKGEYAQWYRDFDQWTNPTPSIPADGKFAAGYLWNLRKVNLDLTRFIALNPEDDIAYAFQLTANRSRNSAYFPDRDYQKILALNPDNAAVYQDRASFPNFSPFRARADTLLFQTTERTWFLTMFDDRFNGIGNINRWTLEELERNAKSDPSNAYAHFYHGLYLALYADDSQSWIRALRALGKAILNAPNFAEAYFERSQTYAALGDEVRAAEDYAQAVSLKPWLADVKTLRQIRDGDARDSYTAAARDSIKAAELKANVAMYTERIKNSSEKVEPILARGQYYARIGNYYSASFDFLWLMLSLPNDWRAYFAGGKIASSTLEQDKAIAYFGRVIALRPDFGEAYRRRGMAYLMKTPSYMTTDVVQSGLYRQTMDRYKNAIADFDRAIALEPADIEARRGKAAAETALGDYLRGVKAAEANVLGAPKTSSSYMEKARANWTIGNAQQAISDYTQAAVLRPDWADIYIERAATDEELGKQAEAAYQKLHPYGIKYAENRRLAISEAKKYLKEYGNYYGGSSRDEIRETIAKGDEEFLIILGSASRTAEQHYRSAICDYGKALTLQPEARPEAYLRKGALEYALAKHLTQRCDTSPKKREVPSTSHYYYLQALADYSTYLEKCPGDALAYAQRSDVYKELSNNDQAREDLTKAIALMPNSATAYFKRGALEVDGKADYIKAVLLDSSYERKVPKPYRQDTDKAWRAQLNMSGYNTKIKENPKRCDAYIERGDAYVDLLQDEKALEDYGEAISLQPDALEAYLKRGAVYYRLGQTEKAAKDYGKVLTLSPSNAQAAEAHYRRGEIYAKAGNQKWAIRSYFRTVELDATYLERIGAEYREAVAGDVSRAMMK